MTYKETQAIISENMKRLTDYMFEDRPLYKSETTVSNVIPSDEQHREMLNFITKTPSLAWQRCPICDGAGRIPTDGTATFKPCDVCDGKKIIGTATGKPPAD